MLSDQANPIFLSREQANAVDRIAIGEFGMQSLVLMENASLAAANLWLNLADKTQDSALIFCGPGNNGGDGLAMARHLYIAGVPIGVVLVGDPDQLSPDCEANWKILRQTKIFSRVLSTDLTTQQIQASTGQVVAEFNTHIAGVAWSSPNDSNACGESSVNAKTQEDASSQNQSKGRKLTWVVDALVGTGAIGPLRANMASIVQVLNAIAAKRFAIDLPSGWDCDQGPTAGVIFHADITCTFVAMKRSFEQSESKDHDAMKSLGEIHVRQIGAPPEVLLRALQCR